MPNQSVFHLSAEVQAAIAGKQGSRRARIDRHRSWSASAPESRHCPPAGAARARSGGAARDHRHPERPPAHRTQRRAACVIAQSDDVHKLSRRDLPIAIARKWDGATTVATTSWIASRVGISVFATGGIGGVHRGELPDISADLPELARTSAVVVCSGAKIILDLPATREWLETNGVTVIGFGTDEFPAFYSRARAGCRWMCARTAPRKLPPSPGPGASSTCLERCW